MSESIARKVSRAGWLCTAFIAAGYAPAIMLHQPVPSMVLAVAMSIPLGARAATPLWAALRGAGYGAIAGVAIWLALSQPMTAIPNAPPTGRPALPPMPPAAAALVIASLAGMCCLTACLFAGLKRRRLRMIDRQWEQ